MLTDFFEEDKIANIIYAFFRVTSAHEPALDFNDPMNGTLRGDYDYSRT